MSLPESKFQVPQAYSLDPYRWLLINQLPQYLLVSIFLAFNFRFPDLWHLDEASLVLVGPQQKVHHQKSGRGGRANSWYVIWFYPQLMKLTVLSVGWVKLNQRWICLFSLTLGHLTGSQSHSTYPSFTFSPQLLFGCFLWFWTPQKWTGRKRCQDLWSEAMNVGTKLLIAITNKIVRRK